MKSRHCGQDKRINELHLKPSPSPLVGAAAC